jgi:serine phosphatase RsbU (regulator of sigma subunit)
VGGDLYDFHVGAGGELLFLVGDVTGKGMGAALLMSSFLASARVLYDTCRDPADLACRLGSILHRSTDSKHFVTGIVGRLDPATGRLDYVNAGHPPPCLVANGALRELESTGVPFGVLADFPYGYETVLIEPGATLALFSDGIPEAQRGEEFFEDHRVQKTLLEASAGAELSVWRRSLLDRVKEFVGDSPRSDDITLLLMRRTA